MHDAYYLLFAVFRAGNEIHGFHVPNIDRISQDVCEDNFRNISNVDEMVDADEKRGLLLLLVSIQVSLWALHLVLTGVQNTG